MKDAGIDISGHKTKSVFEFFKQGRLYDYVITVCDESSGRYFRELSNVCIGVLHLHP
jgi:hypothetical protein